MAAHSSFALIGPDLVKWPLVTRLLGLPQDMAL
jgi:hypothetical protein